MIPTEIKEKSGLISIVLPVYNGEKFLRESIESVLSQTYDNWELIIMDDCSADSSPTIAKEYADNYPQISYYRNEENLRLPRNLNRGFSLAKGEYLTWTSDDNRYRPKALETMLQAMQENKAQFAFASCRIIDEKGNEIEYISVGKDSIANLVVSNSVGACFLYSREVYDTIGDYNPELELVEDFDYWQRIVARFKAVAISEILYDYRQHGESLTNTMNQELFNRNLEKMLLNNLPQYEKLSIQQKYLAYRSLSKCREGKQNPYYFKSKYYSALYWFKYYAEKLMGVKR